MWINCWQAPESVGLGRKSLAKTVRIATIYSNTRGNTYTLIHIGTNTQTHTSIEHRQHSMTIVEIACAQPSTSIVIFAPSVASVALQARTAFFSVAHGSWSSWLFAVPKAATYHYAVLPGHWFLCWLETVECHSNMHQMVFRTFPIDDASHYGYGCYSCCVCNTQFQWTFSSRSFLRLAKYFASPMLGMLCWTLTLNH